MAVSDHRSHPGSSIGRAWSGWCSGTALPLGSSIRESAPIDVANLLGEATSPVAAAGAALHALWARLGRGLTGAWVVVLVPSLLALVLLLGGCLQDREQARELPSRVSRALRRE